MNRFLFWDINAQSQKLGFSEFWDQSQKGSILDYFKKSKQNFNSIFGINTKNDLDDVLERQRKKKLHFPIRKSHTKAKIDQNYSSIENTL